jgi:acetoin utilization protein AcuB
MTPNPACVSPEAPITELRSLLQGAGYRHVPVVDASGRLVGVVSDRDVRAAFPSTVLEPVLEPAHAERLAQVAVAAIMGRPPVALPLEATVDDALLLFDRHRVGALPVVDDGGAVVGIVTMRDVLRSYRRLFGIGIAGSSLVEVSEDGEPNLLPRVATALEAAGIACTALVRVERPGSGRGMVSARVQTYNAHAVGEALRAAGLTPVSHKPAAPGRGGG